MIKIKLRQFSKKLFCRHKRMYARIRRSDDEDYIILDCLDCGKVFKEKNN